MDIQKTLCIIPARLQSKRFPEKALAKILGKPVLEWVYRRATAVGCDVLIATDSEKISRAAENFGAEAILTKTEHKNGTERVSEAAQKKIESSGKKYDLIVNLQGDEPLVFSKEIANFIKEFDLDKHEIFTPISRIEIETPLHYDPNDTFLVKDKQDKALYFSRYAIPFEVNLAYPQTKYRHIGIYAYTPETLKELTGLPVSELEIAESQEQNRWIEYGKQIHVFEFSKNPPAVDSPEQIPMMEKFLRENPEYLL